MELQSYYFPLLFLKPEASFISSTQFPFRLTRRQWSTSTFDLATLATKHRLHLAYQLMDVLLGQCNFELQVDAVDREQALESLSAILLGLYMHGVSPTLAPFVTTHSINEYSGINSRDSEGLRANLPLELQEGLTSETATIEAWPVNLSLQCLIDPSGLLVSESLFQQAATKAIKWLECESLQPALRVVRDAAQSAPMLVSSDQALLHVWCALEALFPKVSTEVTFRVALYLAQLSSPLGGRQDYFHRVRQAYNLRSRVAHGSERHIKTAAWLDTWGLLMDAGNAIVHRGRIPNEDELLQELLATAEPNA